MRLVAGTLRIAGSQSFNTYNMFTRLMAQHPIFGDMRGAVNEKGVVLFLVNDVVDMFGLKPERVVARVIPRIAPMIPAKMPTNNMSKAVSNIVKSSFDKIIYSSNFNKLALVKP